jgi:Lrp/AsnC family leucine-responsive transcriptional regulator
MKRVRYSNGALDETDARILEALSRDGRLPMKDLAQKVGLSAPSVTERVKRLEEAGVIEGYAAQINAAAVGLPLAVYIRVRPMPGELARVAELLASIPEIVECDRVTGDDCFIAKAHVQSVRDLETVIDRLLPYAMTNTSVIQSSPVRRRMPVMVRQ